ncbi:DUF4352 domain-containing protein [Streptosporangium sp. NPDC049078]|uniref:DUF4352 domain-containing protein n=1 Tax=Streptosporangium sp. NPDC049078 TaxID=3155767 RepID=UPI00341D1FE1
MPYLLHLRGMREGTTIHNYQQPAKKPGGGCLKLLLLGVAAPVALLVYVLIGAGSRDEQSLAYTPAGTPSPTFSPGVPVQKAEEVLAEMSTPKPTPKAPGIGDVVRDGKFSFKVTKVERRSAVGQGLLAKKAQGQFVLIHVTVKNVGGKAATFSDYNQKLFDSKYREFKADSGTAVMLLKNSNAYLKQINPGNGVKGILLYDVPKSAKLTTLVLRDSVFSAGARVGLR